MPDLKNVPPALQRSDRCKFSAPMTPLRSSHSLEGIAALREAVVLTVTVYYHEQRRLRSTWGTIRERPGTSSVAQTALISSSNDM